MDTPSTHIHDHSLLLLETGASIKSGGVKLIQIYLKGSSYIYFSSTWLFELWWCIKTGALQSDRYM